MRYIVITLILANVIYFGWRFLSPASEPVKPVAASVDKTQIQLIEDDSLIETAPTPVSEQATTPPARESEKSVGGESVVADAAVASADISETSAEASVAEPVVTSPVAHTICLQTPWTRDEKVLQQWRAGLDESTLDMQTQEVETQRRFLVYIPAKATPAQTLERLRELKSMPVESAHINKGEFMGGISLGLFSQQESATAVLKKVHELGINDAKQTVRVLTATEYRLRRHSTDAPAEPWSVCP